MHNLWFISRIVFHSSVFYNQYIAVTSIVNKQIFSSQGVLQQDVLESFFSVGPQSTHHQGSELKQVLCNLRCHEVVVYKNDGGFYLYILPKE